jgi:tRNA1Val (adenine37-N6)-methyltransferase
MDFLKTTNIKDSPLPNTYFSFKQFTVHQDKCAMKVCTDACILGAWTAEKISEFHVHPQNILDIGAGTGLLSLMLAQKSRAVIHAIELNEDAAAQAKENFEMSRWKERLFLYHTSIQQFPAGLKYDWIISNPPFFEDDLQSDNHAKNSAKHDTTLTLSELLKAISIHLDGEGFASLLIPWHRTAYLQMLAESEGLFIKDMLQLRQSPGHGFFRTLVILSKRVVDLQAAELTIHDAHRHYSPAFTKLLKDYYLRL